MEGKVETVEEAIAVLKKDWPGLRRKASTAIVVSGARRTVLGCLCGSMHTTSTEWNGRFAKHVRDWEAEHAGCAVSLANAHLRGEEVKLKFGR